MTICLSMIVKNEAHCIQKCLESVKPYIDYWVICDTGSTDNTEEVIKECLKDIPGELHHHEWKDFATNRNQALELSRGKADYIFIIDADDHLVIEKGNPFESLEAPTYRINFHHSSIQYTRIQLIHNSISCRYIGVLHEYLDIPPGIMSIILPDCHIFYGASGDRSKNPDKYLHDAEVFEKALESEPDNSRYTFYCAQSYRDANRLAKALTFYTRRAEMGGWNEEVYMSLLEAAKLTERIRPFDSITVEESYIKAHNRIPHRAEALCYLAAYCRSRKFYEKAYFYARLGTAIRKPQDGLFIEPDCYNWRLLDELAIAAFYVGNIEEAAFLNDKLLKRPDISSEDRARILKNLEFCKR